MRHAPSNDNTHARQPSGARWFGAASGGSPRRCAERRPLHWRRSRPVGELARLGLPHEEAKAARRQREREHAPVVREFGKASALRNEEQLLVEAARRVGRAAAPDARRHGDARDDRGGELDVAAAPRQPRARAPDARREADARVAQKVRSDDRMAVGAEREVVERRHAARVYPPDKPALAQVVHQHRVRWRERFADVQQRALLVDERAVRPKCARDDRAHGTGARVDAVHDAVAWDERALVRHVQLAAAVVHGEPVAEAPPVERRDDRVGRRRRAVGLGERIDGDDNAVLALAHRRPRVGQHEQLARPRVPRDTRHERKVVRRRVEDRPRVSA
mmetsp:Transcript_5762/g.18116  ORF Transcript_5762/g.18116 Transcript_5762/m.18116 type:complete len:333 (-) Transcript_5762:331-1329(-)